MSETSATASQTELTVRLLVEDYATRPIEEAFDLPELLKAAADIHSLESDKPLYLVEFDSQRKPFANQERLNALDHQALTEAAGEPGFLFYFQGDTDLQGRCKSFCIWRTREEGHNASVLPAHIDAARQSAVFYESAVLQRRLVQLDTESPCGVRLTEVFPPKIMQFN